jgi:hypothetical protein
MQQPGEVACNAKHDRRDHDGSVMKRASPLLLLCLLIAVPVHAEDLLPFTSDGCSSFPDGTPEHTSLWLDCCIRHDLAYWKGGSYQERLDADLALEQCVAAAGEPGIAKLMLQGVRAGGSPWLLTPYRWGYGWPFGRGYQALTPAERAQVGRHLQTLEQLLRSARESLRMDADPSSR